MADIKAQNQTALASVKAIYDAADEATTLLDGMKQAALDAGTTLDAIYQDAEDAKTAAETAQSSAKSALVDLSTIENVVGTLNWITAHGTMTSQAGGTFDPNKVYFIADPNGDYVVGGIHYSAVAEPVAEDIDNYYVLTVDESVQNYVATHIVVDEEGLWIIPDAGGNKVLIATGSGNKYVNAGTYIVSKIGDTEVTLAQFTATGVRIGQEGRDRVELSAGEMRNITAVGTVPFRTTTDSGVTGWQSVVVQQYGDKGITKRNDTITLDAFPSYSPRGERANLLVKAVSEGKIDVRPYVYTAWSVTIENGSSSSETLPVIYAKNENVLGPIVDVDDLQIAYDATTNKINITAGAFPYDDENITLCEIMVVELSAVKETTIPATQIYGEFQLDIGNVYEGWTESYRRKSLITTSGGVYIGEFTIATSAGTFTGHIGDILIIELSNAPEPRGNQLIVDGGRAQYVVDSTGSARDLSWSAGDILTFKVNEDEQFEIIDVGGDIDANLARLIVDLGWGEDVLGIPI